jgi:hypothetical protein
VISICQTPLFWELADWFRSVGDVWVVAATSGEAVTDFRISSTPSNA